MPPSTITTDSNGTTELTTSTSSTIYPMFDATILQSGIYIYIYLFLFFLRDCDLKITFTQGFRFQAIHLQSSMAEVILKHKITMSLTNIDIHVLLI